MERDATALSSLVARKTGMALSPAQEAALQDYAARRLKALSCSAAEYLGRLEDPEEFRSVVNCLTVRETYFYRYPEQLEAFRDRVLPGLLEKARAESRRVRIWSAGCCTGEEPYTLALQAAELGVAEEVELLATDINEDYLESAMAGVFSRRSVEKVPPAQLASNFEAKGSSFVLAPELRRRVEFKYLNLAEPSYPSFFNGTCDVDAVFCRNVLIYFDDGAIADILGRLRDCLRPHGALALGPSEMVRGSAALFPRRLGEAFFHFKEAEAEPPPPPDPPRPAAVRRRAPPPPPTPPPAPPVPAEPGELLARAQAEADLGRRAQAAVLCRRALELAPLDARGHYLLGLLELGEPRRAHEHFRKAVYLAPEHLLARLHLARCAQALGRASEARREFRGLERLAGGRPASEVLDAEEGLTFGMVALLCRQALGGEEAAR